VIVLAGHPLFDPDLGWNLAGGLWIIDSLQIPTVDPLAALARPWIDYCFLPQILFALVFKSLGFFGLVLLQIVGPVLILLSGGFFIFGKFAPENTSTIKKITPVALLAALILFIVPVFHLRPQLFSLLFFILFLRWRAESRNTAGLLLIMIPWVNTHVYWVFAPVILITDFISARLVTGRNEVKFSDVMLSLLLPVVSPYGVRNYLPVVQYSLFHSHVKELIQEFQPLYSIEGYLLPATFLLIIAIIYFARTRQVRFEDLVLALLFFALSLWQLKFTPLFGVFGVMVLANTRIGYFVRTSFQQRMFVYSLCLSLSVLAALIISPKVGETQRELLKIGAEISKVNQNVFNPFNFGGWLELGVYLANKDSLAKPWIDGRTLVMGEERLSEYFSAYSDLVKFKSFLAQNQLRYLVLKKNSKLSSSVLEEKPPIEYQTENFLFIKTGFE